MKIFISHSSKDKWIARKLSEEISLIGCETFLDEKDIETGDSINGQIKSHLGESDEFLLLLSPDSISSAWVLIEIGGAIQAGKRIVIILLYLGTNDIPSPLKNYLARDINDIEKYYEEIKKRRAGGPQPEKEKRTIKSVNNFKPGDRVRIISERQHHTSHRVGWSRGGGMDKYCGKEVVIDILEEVEKGIFAAKILEDGGKFWWALDWLTLVS